MRLLSRILRRGFGFPAHLRGVTPVDSREVKGQVFIPFVEPCDCGSRWHSPHCDRYERRSGWSRLVEHETQRLAGGMGLEFEEWQRVVEHNNKRLAAAASVAEASEPTTWAEAAHVVMAGRLSERRYSDPLAPMEPPPDHIVMDWHGKKLEFHRPYSFSERMASLHEDVTSIEERGRRIANGLRMQSERPDMSVTIEDIARGRCR